jgi:hypothetical protein
LPFNIFSIRPGNKLSAAGKTFHANSRYLRELKETKKFWSILKLLNTRRLIDLSACASIRFDGIAPRTHKDIDLKFGMAIVFGKLEENIHGFLPESVHKWRHA